MSGIIWLPPTFSTKDNDNQQTGTVIDTKCGADVVILRPKDFRFEVGENAIPGKSFIHKFGRNPDLDSGGGFETIWNGGGDYTGHNPTAGETLEVFSSSANDAGTLLSSGTMTDGDGTTITDTGADFVSDGVAINDMVLNDTDLSHGVITAVTATVLTVFRFNKYGFFSGEAEAGDTYRIATAASTGAAVVELQNLLDSGFANETTEFIIMNGVTAVDTVGTDYMRHSRASVRLKGSATFNVGAITARQKVTTANIMMVLPIGFNNTMITAHTIPMGFEGHLDKWLVSLAGKTNANVTVRLMMRHFGEAFLVKEEFTIRGSGSSYLDRPFPVPKNSLPPGTDIQVTAESDTNDTVAVGSFDLVLSTT